MSALKKIIFLSNNEKDKGMAILQLEKQQSNIFGTIKTYSQKYEGDYILGIKTNEKIIKQNVAEAAEAYSCIFGANKNLYRTIPSLQDGLTNGLAHVKPL